MRWIAVVVACLTLSCGRASRSSSTTADERFRSLAHDILEDRYARHPSLATDLGLHQYDARLEDLSEAAVHDESRAVQQFEAKVRAIDPSTLNLEAQLDREQLLSALRSGIVSLDLIKQWAKDPDYYSSAITNAAYVIMKRAYAPPADRLQALVAREKQMPRALQQARANLQAPPEIYTQIAIEQIDGNIRFFTDDLPAAFAGVTDRLLLDDFIGPTPTSSRRSASTRPICRRRCGPNRPAASRSAPTRSAPHWPRTR